MLIGTRNHLNIATQSEAADLWEFTADQTDILEREPQGHPPLTPGFWESGLNPGVLG